ncbi:Ankyrin repeat domain-containing protein [Balamuthia mandrillaris]
MGTLHQTNKKRRTNEEDDEEEEPKEEEASEEEGEEKACCWVEDLLPEELLCHILGILCAKDEEEGEGSVAAAARTCRRWYRCAPSGLRHKFSLSWACSSMATLQWAHLGQGLHLGTEVCANAAFTGNLEMVQWAREQGCPWDETTCRLAARGGHLAVLEWARDRGCPWDEFTCKEAAGRGHLEVLKWARAKGCPWDEDTCTNAARGGHWEVLKWARENGCPWDPYVCAQAAMGESERLPLRRRNSHFGHLTARRG